MIKTLIQPVIEIMSEAEAKAYITGLLRSYQNIEFED